MSRVPLHVISGAPRSGKSALIVRLVAERPGWLGLVNLEPALARRGAIRQLPLGCPCCVGRIALQVELTRALRETRPSRVLLELSLAAHEESLRRTLTGWPLAQHLRLARALKLPRDETLAPGALELD